MSGLAVTIDGKRYELQLGQITPALARECRAVTGMTPSTFMAAPDIDSAAVIAWLSERARGRKVSLAEMESGISYDNLPDVEQLDDDPVVPNDNEVKAAKDVAADPEAPGGDS